MYAKIPEVGEEVVKGGQSVNSHRQVLCDVGFVKEDFRACVDGACDVS